jgi:urease
MSIGKTMLGRRHVLPSVVHTLVELQVEGTFPTGTYLVTVHHPISSDDGDLEKALYGSFLPIPPADTFPDPNPDDYLPEKMPGAVLPVKDERITLNDGRKRIRLKVMSKGDRPIQVRWTASDIRAQDSDSVGRLPLPLYRDQPSASF